MEGLTEVAIPAGGEVLPGILAVPPRAEATIIFAHGGGSSRVGPRKRSSADLFHEAGMATLWFDLLAGDEATDPAKVFDIELCTARLLAATEYADGRAELRDTAFGYFGVSTGAAAALRASVAVGDVIGAVVSRSGRPDLAGAALPAVTAPTLLVVGSRDPVIVDLNRRARRELRCRNELAVVPGAGHLFEEPGTLEEVGRLATDWFEEYLVGPEPAA